MKLLYITEDRFPPFRADVVELFAVCIPGKGHRISWLMQRGSAAAGCSLSEVWHSSKVYIIPRVGVKGLIGRIMNAFLALLGEWAVVPLAIRGKYDAIQVRDKFFTCISAWIAARMTGAKFFFWMSYPFAESRIYLAINGLTTKRISFWIKGWLSYFLLYFFILRVADHVFVQSDQMLEDVRRHGIPGSKMTVVPMGINKGQVLTAGAAREPDRLTPRLLYLGTLVRIRRLDFLIRMLKIVHQRYPGARLFFVGDGENPEDRVLLEEEVSRNGLENHVVFTGFLPMEEAWRHVEHADICFSPFYPIPMLLSTSPTKLIEYMAKAKNVVANEHPEQCRVLAESGVGRCIPWSEAAFAEEVCRLLDHPEEAKSMAAKGPDYVRAFRTYDVIAAQLDKTYRQLLS
jgi:glycosyltransferase involved in cell wall biosynthesis